MRTPTIRRLLMYPAAVLLATACNWDMGLGSMCGFMDDGMGGGGGCGGAGYSAPGPAIGIEWARDSVMAGDTLRAAARLESPVGTPVPNATFRWASADTTVARVDSTGLIRGTAPGWTTIYVAVTEGGPNISTGRVLRVVSAAPLAARSAP